MTITSEMVSVRGRSASSTVAEAGPDAAARPPLPLDPIRRRRRRSPFERVPRGLRKLSGPLLILGIWAGLSATSTVSAHLLPSPWAVAQAGYHLERTGQLWGNLWASLERVGEGLALGILVGTGLAVLSGLSKAGEDLLDSTMQVFKSVPAFALVPLLIMWFGIDNTPRILLIMLGTSIPVYINTFAAIRNVDRDVVEAARAFGANRWSLITQVILPGSLPGFLVGLRFALTGAWLSLVFAETINVNDGLGYLMAQAQTLLETDVMFFTVVVYAVIGLLSYGLLRLLEHRLLSWRRGFEGS